MYSGKMLQKGTSNLTIEIKTWQDVHRLPIWYNSLFKIGANSFMYRNYFDKGITFVNHLLNDNRDFSTVNTFTEKFGINTNFLQYKSILNSIKRSRNILGIGQFDNKLMNPIRPLTIKLITCNTKGCRSIYDVLIKTKQILEKRFNYQPQFQVHI